MAASKKNIEAVYPLSPTQEGILFHGLQKSEELSYFQQFSCTLRGLKDQSKWQASWQLVAQKHAVLRTFFTWQNKEQPLQVVREHITLPWSNDDWRGLSAEQQSQRFEALLVRDRALGFDLSVAPLVRFILIRSSELEYKFLWSFHHILLDGWSQRLLLNDALTLYSQHHGNNAEIIKAPDYSQFIQYLKKQNQQDAHSFWSGVLAGFKNPSHFCHKNSSSLDNGRDVQEFALPTDLANKLKLCARNNRLTLNTLVVAAWSLIHAQKCQANDLMFGATVAGRPGDLSNAEAIAGLFINTLPVRVKIDLNEALAPWMQKIQQQQTACRNFENTSLAEIQRSSELRSGTSLFDTILVFENLPVHGAELNNDVSINQQRYVEYSHYPLAILIDPSDGIEIIVVHKTDYLSESEAQQIITALERILNQFCEANFAMDMPSEIFSLARLNHTSATSTIDARTELPTNFTLVHQPFEYWAEHTPDATALIVPAYLQSPEQRYSYADLNNKANQMAHYLAEKGVGHGHFLPIMLSRGADVIVGFLAALKLGAAYISIGADTPLARLAQFLEDLDSQQYSLLTHSQYLQQIPDTCKNMICLDQLNFDSSNQPTKNLVSQGAGDTLAYVIYTSGSSGKPKGVMVEHQNLLNSTRARAQYNPQSPEAFLLLSSFTTDSSVAGLYWTLTNGTTLVLAPSGLEQSPEALTAIMTQHKVTHTLCIPSLYQLILEHGNITQCTSLQAVIVAGEACSHAVINQHQALLPNVHLHNEYGPSECTVWATAANLSLRGKYTLCFDRQNHSQYPCLHTE